MKNIFFKLILIIILLLPIGIKADTNALSVSCTSQKVARGSQFQCNLSGNTDYNVSKIEIPFSLGSGLSVSGFEVADSSKMTANTASDNKIEISLSDNLTGNFSIGTLSITVSNDASSGNKAIAFNNIVFYNESNESKSVGNVSSTVVVPASLKSLAVNNNVGVIGPVFSSNTTSYTLTLPANTTSFGLSAEATIQGDEIKLVNSDTSDELTASSITYVTQEGKNEMSVIITVGSGEAATQYTLLVTRQQAASVGNPFLSSLTISGQTVHLRNTGNDNEDIVVTLNTVSSYQVRAQLSDSANYEFSTNTLPSSCNTPTDVLTCNMSGESGLAIVVVPKQSSGSNSTKTYSLQIKKGSGNSSSNGGSTNYNDNAVNNNPQTGGNAAFVMGIVLVISFFTTLYLYRRNMNSY